MTCLPSFHSILEILENHMEHLELPYVENYNDQHKMLYPLLASLCTHLHGRLSSSIPSTMVWLYENEKMLTINLLCMYNQFP